jgi:Transcription factor WhiB
MTTAAALLNRRLLELARRGDRPRCSDPVDHARWTSENPADRAIAALWCIGCVVIVECGDSADERGEKWGVWSGIDRSTIR